MAFLCNQCWVLKSVYELGDLSCNCGGEIVHIDDQMVTIIRILNQKGYKTQYCCSGHDFEENVTAPYVQILLSQSYNVEVPECTGDNTVMTMAGDTIRYHIVNPEEYQDMLETIGGNVKDVHDYLMTQNINVNGMYSLFGDIGYRLIIRMSPIPYNHESIENVKAVNERIEDMLQLVENIPTVKL